VAAAADHGQPAARRSRVPPPSRPDPFVPFALTVLRFEHGRLADIAAFEQPTMFAAFGLPASL
jgi:hypothetical protein